MPGSFPEEDRAAALALLILLNSILYGRANDVCAAQQGRTRFFFQSPLSQAYSKYCSPIQGYAPVHPPAFSQIFLLEKNHFLRDMGGEGEWSRNFERQSNQSCVRPSEGDLPVSGSVRRRRRRRRSDGGPKTHT